jgi:hypothetical protein
MAPHEACIIRQFPLSGMGSAILHVELALLGIVAPKVGRKSLAYKYTY